MIEINILSLFSKKRCKNILNLQKIEMLFKKVRYNTYEQNEYLEKMIAIEVGPVIINSAGKTYGFGSRPGTPSFNIVKDTLEEYLGKNITVNYNYAEFTFVIESDVEDEGCDTSGDFKEVIESICEFMPDTYCGGLYKRYQLQFNIFNVVEN